MVTPELTYDHTGDLLVEKGAAGRAILIDGLRERRHSSQPVRRCDNANGRESRWRLSLDREATTFAS